MKISLIIILTLCVSCKTKDPETDYKLLGTPLPQFELLLTNNSYINSKNIKFNKPIILFYFSPFCPYCRAMINDIKKNKLKLTNSNIYMITYADTSEINKFSNDFKLNQFKNITIGKDCKNKLSNYFSIKGVPFIAIYDIKNKLSAQHSGIMPVRKLTRLINN